MLAAGGYRRRRRQWNSWVKKRMKEEEEKESKLNNERACEEIEKSRLTIFILYASAMKNTEGFLEGSCDNYCVDHI